MLRAVVGGFSGIAAGVVLLAACAAHTQSARLGLQLPPVTFGGMISLHQQLIVERDGLSSELEAALEIDPQRIDLVAITLHQRVLSLHFDGRALQSWRHPALPAELRAEDVLEDLQLTLWPAEIIAAALPAGWRIEENGLRRILRQGGQPVSEIDYSGTPRWLGTIVMNNLRYRYRLTIQSVATGQQG